jgi:hypothetical protein
LSQISSLLYIVFALHNSIELSLHATAGTMEATPGLFQFCPGRQPMPIDSEMKAKTIRLFSFAMPYMRAFHLNWCAHGLRT